ncbi:hypothetical protein FDP41_011230 [Naegleria fowleri]|uniref:Uncharacterized protein n=1 Tax=Naegleria fowleri TaxID=5763 RepID=A0A6A5C987_NAEFO|nr:uncharacterized protein FDP41_011230 [Naegleria fowleri]KAF0982300.1 hypothetical protein FDP41_011230 [Naegleria fowleri]CAG4711136.1 unnamed protein product [Naegleria fowleri]
MMQTPSTPALVVHDLIFDQLEDLGNDTFSEFDPVGFHVGSYGSNNSSSVFSSSCPPSPHNNSQHSHYGYHHSASSDHLSETGSVDHDYSMMMVDGGMMSSSSYHHAPPSPSNYSNDDDGLEMNHHHEFYSHHSHQQPYINHPNGHSQQSQTHHQIPHHQASTNGFEDYYYSDDGMSGHYSTHHAHSSYHHHHIKESMSMPNMSSMRSLHSSQQQQPSSTIHGDLIIKDLFVQDHTGKNIDSSALSNYVLKCHHQFFGIVFDDSFHGPSISQFYPTDIVTVVRQSDRIGVYLQFRRFLTCKTVCTETLTMRYPTMNEHWSKYADEQSWTDPRSHFYKDSPLSTCLYTMIEFYNEQQIQYLFAYLENNMRLLECLKMVYPQWMFCAHFCTSNDVQLIYLAVQNKQFSKEVDHYVSVRASNNDEDSTAAMSPSASMDLESMKEEMANSKRMSTTNTPISRTGFVPKWAKKANSNVQVGVLTTLKQYHFKNRAGSSSRNKASIIDFKKIELIVPPNFYSIALDVRNFCEELLISGRLLPYQLSVGLCNTLAIAQTEHAKMRAKQVVKALSKHPTVQLRNLSAVARYIISSNLEQLPQSQSVTTKSTTEQQKNSNGSGASQQAKSRRTVSMAPDSTSSHRSRVIEGSTASDNQLGSNSQRKRSLSAQDDTLNTLFSNLRLTNVKGGEYGKHSSMKTSSSNVGGTGTITTTSHNNSNSGSGGGSDVTLPPQLPSSSSSLSNQSSMERCIIS